eukprot:46838-Eustigmatos_ZCMA.PRE.1
MRFLVRRHPCYAGRLVPYVWRTAWKAVDTPRRGDGANEDELDGCFYDVHSNNIAQPGRDWFKSAYDDVSGEKCKALAHSMTNAQQ